MRVLVVTVVHHPQDARILHRQIGALIDAGHEVVYAAPFRDCRVRPPARVRPVDLPRSHGRRRLAAAYAARRAVAREAPGCDLVLLHDPELLVAVAGLTRPVTVWDVHEDTAAAVTLKPWLPPALRPATRRAVQGLERLAEQRFRLLLAEEGYRGRFRREHPVVPNTTWVPRTVPPPGTDRVVYLGSLSRARGAGELVELARELQGQVRVELVGGADRDARGLLEDAHRAGLVHWHGFVPNGRAVTLLDGALAGMSLLRDEPNYRHSLPTKVVEYMAHGVPVVTTPLPAAVQLVEQAGSGIVVPFDDPAAAAAAVRRLRADRGLREALGSCGHAAARARFDWRSQGRAFLAVLEAWAGGATSSTVPLPPQSGPAVAAGKVSSLQRR